MELRRGDDHWLLVGGPVPPGADAITIGPLISVRERSAGSAILLRHERVHVHQWRTLGAVRFLSRYLGAYLLWRLRGKGHRGAYLRIPLEVEAAWFAARPADWAAHLAGGAGADGLPAAAGRP